MRAEGLIAFEGGEVSTFDIGYTASTVAMDLQLLGTTGIIGMDDFVLDWTNTFAFKNAHTKAGYVHRKGMATRNEGTFVETPSGTGQEVLMMEDFAELAASGDAGRHAEYVAASLKTQEYLDAIWTAANG